MIAAARSLATFLVVCAAAPSLIPANAGAQALYAPPDDFWVAPVQRPIKLFGPTSPEARWFIAQWGNPDPLGGFHPVGSTAGGKEFRAESPSASVTLRKTANGTEYTFSQNGGNIPCGPGEPIKEFDLFAQIVNAAVAPGLPSAELFPPPSKAMTLSDMSSLQLSANLRIGRSWTTGGADDCPNNAVNVLSALVLRDTVASPPQVLYYQLSMFEFCGQGPQANACDRNRLKRMFWWNGITDRSGGAAVRKRFGYRDALASFSAAPMPGGATDIDVDLKPRLMEILATGSNGLDSDPSHWVLTGTYHGQSLFGKAGLESTWKGFALTVGSARNGR